jgi:hypothetical protein
MVSRAVRDTMHEVVTITRWGDRSHGPVLLGFLLLTVVAGCTPVTRRPPSAPSLEDVRDEAFRAGVQAALNAYADHYLENDFPYDNWHSPVVQQTFVPPQITGGVFIPGHMDYVMIKPGAYKREFAAPLSSRHGLRDERPYVRERPVGWADEEAAHGRAPVESRPPEPRIPHTGREGDVSGSARPWADLPPPSARWLGK